MPFALITTRWRIPNCAKRGPKPTAVNAIISFAQAAQREWAAAMIDLACQLMILREGKANPDRKTLPGNPLWHSPVKIPDLILIAIYFSLAGGNQHTRRTVAARMHPPCGLGRKHRTLCQIPLKRPPNRRLPRRPSTIA